MTEDVGVQFIMETAKKIIFFKKNVFFCHFFFKKCVHRNVYYYICMLIALKFLGTKKYYFMKKIFLSVCALGLALGTYAQAIVDNAVIPVSVNINTIMRMNVVSGGNIEFSFNTIEQYTKGIENSDRYDTRFTVASSVDFKVEMYAEDASLKGSDDASNEMDLNLVTYKMEANNSSAVADLVMSEDWKQLSEAATEIVVAGGGDAVANDFTINWSCGDATNSGAAASVLSKSLAPDRYSTNVFLVLSKQE